MKKFNTIACALFALVSSAHIAAAPIHDAAKRGDIKALQEALKAGTDVNEKDGYAYTPLHLATMNGHCDAMRLLLEHGVDVRDTLYLAIREGNCDAMRLLLEHGADVRDELLHLAVFCNYCDAMRLLLEYSADVNEKNNWGETPLHQAANCNRCDAMRVLLDYGADANIQNRYGKTALMIATEKGHYKCVEILKDAPEADPSFCREAQEFMKNGSLSMTVALMRDHETPVEGDLYEGGVPQAWWKMPFEMCSMAGVRELEVPVQHDVGEKDWKTKGWKGDALWCQ